MSGENQSYGPGFIGFVVIFVLAVAVYLLMRNMTMRLRRLRYSPDARATETSSDPARTEQSGRASRPPEAGGPSAASSDEGSALDT